MRPNSDFLDNLIDKPFPLLDHGYLMVKDYMGTEQGIIDSARVSYGRGTCRGLEDAKLLRYLLRHKHTTPFEMAEIKIHVKLPIFVARQWIRHRTANVNEYSGRYSIMDKEFYIPNPEQLAAQSQTNKQGRGRLLNSAESARVLQILKEDCARNYDHYLEMANVDEDGKPLDNGKDGLARELARMGLSLNFYTQWYWKTDVHNLLHFIHLRADSHAQYEIQVYANVLKDILKGWLPNVYQAAVDYKFEAENMSRMEMEVIRFFADQLPKQGMNPMLDNLGVVGRERQEFYTKLGL